MPSAGLRSTFRSGEPLRQPYTNSSFRPTRAGGTLLGVPVALNARSGTPWPDQGIAQQSTAIPAKRAAPCGPALTHAFGISSCP